MVNIITIAFVHAILFIAAVRLMMRSDLDEDTIAASEDAGSTGGADDVKQLSASERRRARLRESGNSRDT